MCLLEMYIIIETQEVWGCDKLLEDPGKLVEDKVKICKNKRG